MLTDNKEIANAFNKSAYKMNLSKLYTKIN